MAWSTLKNLEKRIAKLLKQKSNNQRISLSTGEYFIKLLLPLVILFAEGLLTIFLLRN